MNLKIKNKTFLYYFFSAGSSFALDLFLFTIFNIIFSHYFQYEAIFVATILARILSSLYNFIINSKYVFKNYSPKMLIKYYVLVVVQMLVSSLLVYFINKYLLNLFATLIKFFVDIVLFIVNYFVQKHIVFR